MVLCNILFFHMQFDVVFECFCVLEAHRLKLLCMNVYPLQIWWKVSFLGKICISRGRNKSLLYTLNDLNNCIVYMTVLNHWRAIVNYWGRHIYPFVQKWKQTPLPKFRCKHSFEKFEKCWLLIEALWVIYWLKSIEHWTYEDIKWSFEPSLCRHEVWTNNLTENLCQVQKQTIDILLYKTGTCIFS